MRVIPGIVKGFDSEGSDVSQNERQIGVVSVMASNPLPEQSILGLVWGRRCCDVLLTEDVVGHEPELTPVDAY